MSTPICFIKQLVFVFQLHVSCFNTYMLWGHNRIAAQEDGKQQKQAFTERFVETNDV